MALAVVALALPSPIFALHDSARSTLPALMKGHCVAVALLELIPQRGGLGGLSLGRLGGLSLGGLSLGRLGAGASQSAMLGCWHIG